MYNSSACMRAQHACVLSMHACMHVMADEFPDEVCHYE